MAQLRDVTAVSGWVDLVALKYAIMINGVTQLIMMKGDVLIRSPHKACVAYEKKWHASY